MTEDNTIFSKLTLFRVRKIIEDNFEDYNKNMIMSIDLQNTIVYFVVGIVTYLLLGRSLLGLVWKRIFKNQNPEVYSKGEVKRERAGKSCPSCKEVSGTI